MKEQFAPRPEPEGEPAKGGINRPELRPPIGEIPFPESHPFLEGMTPAPTEQPLACTVGKLGENEMVHLTAVLRASLSQLLADEPERLREHMHTILSDVLFTHLDSYPFIADDVEFLRQIRDTYRYPVPLAMLNGTAGVIDVDANVVREARHKQLHQYLDEAKRHY